MWKVLMPLVENRIVYKCAKKLLKPKNQNSGRFYKHLPVTRLNRVSIPQSNINSTMFLTLHSIIITNVGIGIPCSGVFITKLKTYTWNWIKYTKDGIQETGPPKKISWSKDIDINIYASINVSFSIDKGLYSFDTIETFDEIQMFIGETKSILSTIVRNFAKRDGTGKGHKVIHGK